MLPRITDRKKRVWKNEHWSQLKCLTNLSEMNENFCRKEGTLRKNQEILK
jgi:hypothetical protein